MNILFFFLYPSELIIITPRMAFKFPTQLTLVYICTFIDALGYSFVIPILPYFLEQVGGSSSDLGLLTSIYAITQGISMPFLLSIEELC